ncbi:hypothetical protein N7474_009657 [Penicillium riverlandense]|uniref:uncharacterized protein n=1 Tax=Penicillium riverlandense TaxID=1903569 RepID=UPI002547DFA9|nr:uncharacterized protein N7474_009657 [Penicillium riverlandense]KAJ5808388.1 hypothetical protein N7474_009657 [Penicillium riverlandense]
MTLASPSSHGFSGPINLGKLILHFMQSKTLLPMTMEDAYANNIGLQEFDLYHNLPFMMQLQLVVFAGIKRLPSSQEAAVEHQILDCLARMVYGSNMIEHAGRDLDITLKLCLATFGGEEIPEDIGETNEEFLALKQHLMQQNLPSNTSKVLRSRNEIVQHAKAAAFIISQLCVHGANLSEEIILETHRILTYKVDAENAPWAEYGGVYRLAEVSVGLRAFPHPSLVPYKMSGMIRELQSDLKEAVDDGTIDAIALAAKYTHIFANIHPFIDGNGRMCRLILNALLIKLGSVLVCIGEDETDRSTYLDINANAGALEDMYEDAEEDEKPKLYKELATFTLAHVHKIMMKLNRVT